MKVLALTRYGRLGASSRVRFLQFIPRLAAAGIEVNVAPLLRDELLNQKYRVGRYPVLELCAAYLRRILLLARARNFDVLWIEKEALPWMPAWFEALLLRAHFRVLDFDDAIFHNYDLHHSAFVRVFLGHRIDSLMRLACHVTAGNDYLAARALKAPARRVTRIPTVVDTARYQPLGGDRTESDEPMTIVWIGSPSTLHYIQDLVPVLRELSKSIPLRLRVIGARLEEYHIPVENRAWSEESEVRDLQDATLGIMPLADTPWERGKCAYKLIQYMACGLPVVASRVGANVEVVTDGVTGLLASSPEEWKTALERLASDAPLRRRMARAGRQKAVSLYSVDAVVDAIAEVLTSCSPSPPRRP